VRPAPFGTLALSVSRNGLLIAQAANAGVQLAAPVELPTRLMTAAMVLSGICRANTWTKSTISAESQDRQARRRHLRAFARDRWHVPSPLDPKPC
jgi:hypothetical protein